MTRPIAVPPSQAGRDELGTPDEHLARCADCRTVFRVGGWHRCGDERVEWEDATLTEGSR